MAINKVSAEEQSAARIIFGMASADPGLRLVQCVLGLLELLPLILLFVDYRRRSEIHKPLIYLVVLAVVIFVLSNRIVPITLGLAFCSPFAVLIYAFLARSKRRRS